jgi:hypothetical protein
VDDNCNPSILEWVDLNYLRTSMYDDAQVNVLKEALPLHKNNRSKRIKKDKRNP